MTMLALVAAMDCARAIGKGNAMPWHLPDDLKRFKALTVGKPVLMGRRTAEAIGRALPGRPNWVLSRGRGAPFAGQRVVHSLAQAVEQAGAAELMVIGGGEIYALALPQAQRLHLTLVDARIDGADTWFPAFDPAVWRETFRQHHPADARHAFGFDFVDCERMP